MNSSSGLTKEEKDILEMYDRGGMKSVMTTEARQEYVAAARQTFKKDKRVNIRLSGKDLELLQERALIEGIPCQTLMSSILHKYVQGRLQDSSDT